jgi:hypothetical protein
MDALNELKRLHDMMVQYRDAIQRWDAEIMHADETAEQIRDLRTQLQRAYAKLEDTFAKWGGVSLPRYPLSAAGTRSVFDIALDGSKAISTDQRLEAIDQSTEIINRAIGKLEARSETWQLLSPATIVSPEKDDVTGLMPAFLWEPVEGAIGYEFVIAEDIGGGDPFTTIDYSATTSTNSHLARESLKYGTRYNWRVRAFNRDARGPWNSVSFDTAPAAERVNRLGSPAGAAAEIQVPHITAEDRKSVFMIYGGPDEEFASRLNQAIRDHGIETFFFPKQAIPGQKLHRLMSEELNRHDRAILVCSRNSLERAGVLNEIEEALAREAREGGECHSHTGDH